MATILDLLRIPYRREVQFDPVPQPGENRKRRRWRFDFLLDLPPDAAGRRLAIEVDGGSYGMGKACPLCKHRRAGRHTSAAGFAKDHEKMNHALLHNFGVLRFTTQQVRNGEALAFLESWQRSNTHERG